MASSVSGASLITLNYPDAWHKRCALVRLYSMYKLLYEGNMVELVNTPTRFEAHNYVLYSFTQRELPMYPVVSVNGRLCAIHGESADEIFSIEDAHYIVGKKDMQAFDKLLLERGWYAIPRSFPKELFSRRYRK